jgi:hypothetical protein
MEAEVHILEQYFQRVKQWFTMTNLRFNNNKEADLLVYDHRKRRYWHVESRVTEAYHMTLKETETSEGKPHRRGLDYFIKTKFEDPNVVEGITAITGTKRYGKILVILSVTEREKKRFIIEARKNGILVMFMSDIINELVGADLSGIRDDVIRTVNLVQTALTKGLESGGPFVS